MYINDHFVCVINFFVLIKLSRNETLSCLQNILLHLLTNDKRLAHVSSYLQFVALLFPGMSRDVLFPRMLLFPDNNIRGNNIPGNIFPECYYTNNEC